MKIELIVETSPHSFEAEDEISNALQDDGLRSDLEIAIEIAIEKAIENIMSWRDIHVIVQASV